MLKTMLRYFGYELRRIPPERDRVYDDVFQALYSARNPTDVRFYVPISHCIDSLGFSYAADRWHPYTAALAEFAAGTTRTFAGSLLRSYYRDWQPGSAAELFPELGSSTGNIADSAPDSHLVPWLAELPEERIDRTRKNLAREPHGSVTGHTGRVPANPLFGPMSDEEGELEYRRLVSIYESMRKRGMLLGTDRRNDLQGLLLRNDSEYRFLLQAGKHRAAAASVLGHHAIPVRLRRAAVIDPRDVEFWPLVRDGTWEASAAIRYFDRIVRGQSAYAVGRTEE